jgi:hypothetical protein
VACRENFFLLNSETLPPEKKGAEFFFPSFFLLLHRHQNLRARLLAAGWFPVGKLFLFGMIIRLALKEFASSVDEKRDENSTFIFFSALRISFHARKEKNRKFVRVIIVR